MSRTRIPEGTKFSVGGLSDEGYGLAHFQANEQAKQREVLIKGALPGEQVTARVHKRRRGQFWAEAQELIEVSPLRVAPPCSHFPRCGGCMLQHMSYPQQLQHKQQLLLDQLTRVAVGYEQLRSPVGGPRLHYRSKARLGVRKLGDDLLLGFRESFGSRVLRMEQCLTLTAELAALVDPIRATLRALSIADAIPQIELAVGDGVPQVVVRHLQPLSVGDLQLLQELQLTTGATLVLQSGGPETLKGLNGWQPPLLSYGLPQYGLDMCFSALDFTQVNLALNQQLISRVVAELAPLSGEQSQARVVDMFCGIGNFSLPLAQRGAQVLGIEGSAASVARATANAQRNGLAHNSQFLAMDLYSQDANQLFHAGVAPDVSPDVTPDVARATAQDWFSGATPATALLLDPPRSGAGPSLGHWLSSPALAELGRVTYVSCNPVSFADDAKVLLNAGFVLEQVGVFDMFPQTAHVETLGIFRRG